MEAPPCHGQELCFTAVQKGTCRRLSADRSWAQLARAPTVPLHVRLKATSALQQGHRDISLSPPAAEGSPHGWDCSTCPWQTSPGSTKLGSWKYQNICNKNYCSCLDSKETFIHLFIQTTPTQSPQSQFKQNQVSFISHSSAWVYYIH